MKRESINRLHELLQNIPERINQVKDENFALKPHPDKWSKKQILGHLIDSAANNHQRFIRIQYEDVPTIVYDQNKWNELNHYETLDRDHVLTLWTLFNKHILEVVQHIPEEQLSRTGSTGLPQPATLGFLIDDYVEHMEHHLRQIVQY
ncbi:MAG: DinB family protein [Bacteroidota bacterium]